MTDHGNLFGAVKFYHAARAAGVHPVIGCEVYVSQQGYKTRSEPDRYNHLVLLCENQEGYRNLIKLVSTGYLEGFITNRASIWTCWPALQGLIGLSACLRGRFRRLCFGQARGRRAWRTPTPTFWAEDFFLEVQDHHLDQDRRLIPELNRLAQQPVWPLGHQRLALPAQGGRTPARDPALPSRPARGTTTPTGSLGHARLYLKSRDNGAAVRRAEDAPTDVGNRAALPGTDER